MNAVAASASRRSACRNVQTRGQVVDGVASADHDCRAGIGEPLGDAAPDALGATGDDGHLAADVDLDHLVPFGQRSAGAGRRALGPEACSAATISSKPSHWRADVDVPFEPERDLMADPAAAVPQVQRELRLLVGQPGRLAVEVEAHLLAGARRDGHDRSSDRRGDRAVDVPTDHPLAVAVAADDRRRSRRRLRGPSSSIHQMPVSNGGWCIAISTGLLCSRSSVPSSHASWASPTAPWAWPRTLVSRATRATSPRSAT